MPAQHQIEYAQVNRSTGEILEGPMALPQNWGNVSGFWHLSDAALTKYDWYPVRDDGLSKNAAFELLFLPEHQFFVKILLSSQGIRPTVSYAISQLYLFFAYISSKPFYSGVIGEVYMFPNQRHEQIHRQNCILIREDYKCMAETLAGVQVRVLVPNRQIVALVKDAVNTYNERLENLFRGLEDISSATDAEIRAILDTNFVDYYG